MGLFSSLGKLLVVYSSNITSSLQHVLVFCRSMDMIT